MLKQLNRLRLSLPEEVWSAVSQKAEDDESLTDDERAKARARTLALKELDQYLENSQNQMSLSPPSKNLLKEAGLFGDYRFTWHSLNKQLANKQETGVDWTLTNKRLE